jgi:peptidoglycan/LPS O-acetylase OafA/YrhL
MTHKSFHPAYRPDIDGLRAIAVLAVVIYHAFPKWLPGGFVGVDIFFVISGYLISNIIITGLEKKEFSFADFYARRVKRIFPALLLVLFATLAFGWATFFTGQIYSSVQTMLGKHVAAASSFMGNILLWTESGYFDADAEMKPLLHLWSLGVEEQFYIFWPWLLIAGLHLRLRLWTVILAVGICSFILNITLINTYPDFVFYLPFTRMWELLAGAAFAWMQMHPVKSQLLKNLKAETDWLHELPSVIGLSLIVIALVTINKGKPFPGYWALLPVAGTVLLIAAGKKAWINRFILSCRPAVFFGKISYPLYLWHWPLLSFTAILVVDSNAPWLRASMVLLGVILAWLTYRFVEKPVRFGPAGRKTQISVLLMLLVLFAGLLSWRYAPSFIVTDKQKYADFFDNTGMRYATRHSLWKDYRDDCDFYDVYLGTPKKRINPACYAHTRGKKVFIWGDSHAQQMYYGLRATLPEKISIRQIATSGCAPSLTDSFPDSLAACNRSNRFALQKIAALRPDVVVLAQRADHENTDWDDIATELKKRGVKNVLLLGPVPQWNPQLWAIILSDYWQKTPQRIATNYDMAAFKSDAALREEYAEDDNLEFVSLIQNLCTSDGCLAYTDAGRRDGLMTFDYGHMTREGSLYVAHTITAPIIEKMLNGQ